MNYAQYLIRPCKMHCSIILKLVSFRKMISRLKYATYDILAPHQKCHLCELDKTNWIYKSIMNTIYHIRNDYKDTTMKVLLNISASLYQHTTLVWYGNRSLVFHCAIFFVFFVLSFLTHCSD